MKQSNIVKILLQLEGAGVDPFSIIKDVNLQENAQLNLRTPKFKKRGKPDHEQWNRPLQGRR